MSLSLTTAIELCPGVQISEFDSSTRDKTYRVERNDGRHFQINEKLYHLLDCLRTPLSLAALGSEFQRRTGQTVATEQLQQIGAQLAEQGIVIESGQTPLVKTTAQEPSAYLGLHYRRDLFAAETLAPFARMLQICFRRPVAALLLISLALESPAARHRRRRGGLPATALRPRLLGAVLDDAGSHLFDGYRHHRLADPGQF
jgi:hypothetical protein